MDFSDLISDTTKTNSYRVQPVRSPLPTIIGKNCDKCGQYYKQDMYLPSRSWYFPDGYLNICNECLGKYLGDGTDLQKADRFCQYADIPFNPNEWISLANANECNCFKDYAMQRWNKKYEEIDWKSVHDEWKEILKAGAERTKIDVLNAKDLETLREKWGRGFNTEQLLHFESMYNDIEKTQSITTAIQKDNARKMCFLSYQIEEAIWAEDENGKKGTEVKALISAYDQLAKSSDFTPKNAKNVGDFDSVGELCAFLEKRGFKNKFYDWVPRDEIDKVMENLQKYTKRIVMGETNIAEELGEKLSQIQALNDLDNTSINDDDERYEKVDFTEDLADEANEDFEIGEDDL